MTVKSQRIRFLSQIVFVMSETAIRSVLVKTVGALKL